MNRRHLLAALAFALLLPSSAPANQLPIVGLLISHPPVDDVVVGFFREGLKQHGLEDGKNIKLEIRSALGRLELVPGLAKQLVELKADVIVVANELTLRAASEATKSIPIVTVGFTGDPVALGWIDSFRRPGKNITGIFNVNAALTTKRLQLLKETIPSISKVTVLWDKFGAKQLQDLQQVAADFSVELQPIEILEPTQLESAFAKAKEMKSGAILMNFSPVFWVHRARIAKLGLETGMPTVTDFQGLVEAGGLLFYGSDYRDNWNRVGYFVSRLLQGAKAATLPVEQISKIVLVVNQRTAKTLGIKLPDTILLRADEVIR